MNELVHGLDYAWKNLQGLNRRRRVWMTIADYGAIQHTITVDEDRPFEMPVGQLTTHRTDSHLVSDDFKRGCETSRCQITAWNASE